MYVLLDFIKEITMKKLFAVLTVLTLLFVSSGCGERKTIIVNHPGHGHGPVHHAPAHHR